MLSASECKFAAWPEEKEMKSSKQMCSHCDSYYKCNYNVHSNETIPLESHPTLRAAWKVAGGKHPLLNVIWPEGSSLYLTISGTYPDTVGKTSIQLLRKRGRGKQSVLEEIIQPYSLSASKTYSEKTWMKQFFLFSWRLKWGELIWKHAL